MSTPIQWKWDSRTIMQAIELIDKALAAKHGPISFRQALASCRDDLHIECEELERNGIAEECNEAYLAIFDGLSLLSLALSGRAINTRFLGMAKDHLQRFFDCEVAS